MNEPETEVFFEERQRAFATRLHGRGVEALETGTVVVIPSISFPAVELRKITGIQHYEERMLFALLWLARPELRIVYVTSHRIDPTIIEYYLSWLDDPAHARRRLELVVLDDNEPRALSAKLLERPDVLDCIKEKIVAPEDSYLLPFNVTTWERTLSDVLGIALYGPAPEQAYLGSKSGSRRVAREGGVPVLAGSEDLYSIEELEEAIGELCAERPTAEALVLKLNLGFSGQGNAIVETSALAPSLSETPIVFCAEEESWESFARKISLEGGIVEELVRHPRLISPSAQLRILPGGIVESVSTHDQILGGPDSQVYLGCRFPAKPEYRSAIASFGMRIGEVLSEAGVMGSFGLDFIGVPSDGGHDLCLGEINLRMGGTTHTFQMASLVTRGTYDPARGELLARGRPVYYVATDNLKSESYRRFGPLDVIQLLDKRGLSFDRTTNTGATLHLMGALPGYGKLGALCIAASPEEADALYDEVVASLDE